MHIVWKFSRQDISRTRDFVAKYSDDAFVRRRVSRNLGPERLVPTRSSFWKALVACLLTTQQRSGPNSRVSRFLREVPFPLSWRKCAPESDLETFVRRTISARQGLRRASRIAAEATANFELMRSGWWDETRKLLRQMVEEPTPNAERAAAQYLQRSLRGFGPKQSRNLLQTLGLTRYEIPLDSRVVKWLNDIQFPVELSARGLADEDYYSFVMDGVQELCAACGVLPCVLDAVVFASFDKGGWKEEEVVF